MERDTAAGTGPVPASAFILAAPGIRIAPSLLAADFFSLEGQLAPIEAAGVSLLHLDVMDGHFVPIISFGAPVIASVRPRTKLFFDAHLMITDPRCHAEGFVNAGCQHITFHIEATNDPAGIVEHIQGLGVSVGVALNPTTPISAISDIIERVVWIRVGQHGLHESLEANPQA